MLRHRSRLSQTSFTKVYLEMTKAGYEHGLIILRFQLLQTEHRARLADVRNLSSAFIVALFVEMYGFPLTIYLLSGWLARKFRDIDPLGHDFGHLWYMLLGFKGDPHWNPIHIASNVLIVAGFFPLSAAWSVLYRAQQESISRANCRGTRGHRLP